MNCNNVCRDWSRQTLPLHCTRARNLSLTFQIFNSFWPSFSQWRSGIGLARRSIDRCVDKKRKKKRKKNTKETNHVAGESNSCTCWICTRSYTCLCTTLRFFFLMFPPLSFPRLSPFQLTSLVFFFESIKSVRAIDCFKPTSRTLNRQQ